MKLQTEESRYKPTKRGTSWYKLYRTTQTDLSQQKRIRNISNASEKNRVFYNYKLWRISEADEGKLGQLMFYWAADRHIVCRSRRQYTLTEAASAVPPVPLHSATQHQKDTYSRVISSV